MTRAWRVGLACGLVGALTLRTADAQQPASSPPPAAARPMRTTAVAGVHYKAGWFHRWLLGTHYRDLWATPVEVEQLDLSRFAGGLTPTGCGGRRQTKVLRLLGADGRQYVFRSIDKDPSLALPPELRATFAKDVIQDQISSAHPARPRPGVRPAGRPAGSAGGLLLAAGGRLRRRLPQHLAPHVRRPGARSAAARGSREAGVGLGGQGDPGATHRLGDQCGRAA